MDDDLTDDEERAFAQLAAAAGKFAESLKRLASQCSVMEMDCREFIDEHRQRATPAREIAESLIARHRL